MNRIALVVTFVLTLLSLSIVAATAGEAPALPEPEANRETLLSLILKGGPVMIPLGICSILAIALAIERFVSLQKSRLLPEGFVDGLKATWDGKEATIEDGVIHCEQHPSPLARMLKPGIKNMVRGDEAVEKSIEDAGVREADKLHRSLRGLSIIAAVSPLLGLLGTVYGLIGAFQDATTKELGKGQELAAGIYEALVTTAAGLTIAIPVLLAYQLLRARADGVIEELGHAADDFADHYLLAGTRKLKPMP